MAAEDMGKTEVAATVQELVSSIVQDSLIENSVLIPTVQQFPVEPGMDTLKIPRAGTFNVDSKTENTDVTPQLLTYATDDLVLDQYKVIQVKLEDNARVQAKPDVVADIVERMARQLALDIDTYLVTQLEATSAAAPDHRIAYAGAALGKADILAARALLHAQNITFSECTIAVSAASEADLLAIDDFVHADKYGSSEGLRNGELGRLYGAPVVMSNQIADLKTLVYHPSHVGFARQIQPLFETERKVQSLANLYSLSQLYGAITLDSGKRGVMLGTAA
jgi:N4-gp56 family major capsid protein